MHEGADERLEAAGVGWLLADALARFVPALLKCLGAASSTATTETGARAPNAPKARVGPNDTLCLH